MGSGFSSYPKFLPGGLLALALVFGSAQAGRPFEPRLGDPVTESWRWRAFPELNGLGLRCLAEGPDGTVWFGTDEGVRGYNGLKWEIRPPKNGVPSAPVNALCAARDGSVYAGTERGIARLSNGMWQRVLPAHGNLPWPTNDLIQTRDGAIWAATAWGLVRLRPEKPVLYTSEDMAVVLQALVPQMRIVTVPSSAVPHRNWPDGIGMRVAEAGATGLPRSDAPVIVWELAPGGSAERAGLRPGDRILAVMGNQPISYNDALSGANDSPVVLRVKQADKDTPFDLTVRKGPVEGTFGEFSVFDVFEDKDGALWLGMECGPILRFNVSDSDTPWVLYTKTHGLRPGRVPRIGQTRDGIIWTVSAGAGVNRFDGRRWTHVLLSDKGGSDSNTSVLGTQDGALWIGGFSLHVYRDSRWHIYRPAEIGIPSHRIRLLATTDSALWVAGLGQGAVRLDYGSARWSTYEGLNFQCETADGSLWFISQDSGVVRFGGKAWTRYGAEDGLMRVPASLIASSKGGLWAAGSHDSTAASARFNGERWRDLQLHPHLSWGFYPRLFEAADGSFWLGAGGNFSLSRDQSGGILRYDGVRWTHFVPPESPMFIKDITQTPDGALWVGGRELRRFDQGEWAGISKPRELANLWSEAVCTTPHGDLWAGTRTYGLFRLHEGAWIQYDVRQGLADNWVRSLLADTDGTLWAATPKGVSRFDGQSWMTYALPQDLLHTTWISLHQSRDDGLWINDTFKGSFRSIRYTPETVPPTTELVLSPGRIEKGEDVAILWKGTDPWRETPANQLRFAWHLNGEAWSPFIAGEKHILRSLPVGEYVFEVKARDRDFNEDPTPASFRFKIVPPVWQTAWFLTLIAVFVGAVGIQTVRLIRRDRRLAQANCELGTSNAALSLANKELYGLNRDLQRERAVERTRSEVQAMEGAEDFKQVFSTLAQDMGEVGLHFDKCGIDVLDNPVDEPSISHFEACGFKYTTYTIDTEGKVLQKSYALTAPFPGVIAETLKRFINGQPWQNTSNGQGIVEVPIARYGRLRLTASEEQGFSGEEIGILEDFAIAIALGYRRYLDFVTLEKANQEIKAQTERKSAFLASMSHELRTPITAMKGYADNILDDIGGKPNERHERYIKRITENASYLLTMVNDLLDLSKIEAGRMEVEAGLFSVKNLVASCCGTVEPLVQEGVVLVQDVAENADEAHTDEDKLRHVLGNLLSNAVKFTEEGEIALRAKKVHDQLVITVSDTGIGIPQDALATIFDEFQQVKHSEQKQKGTGLGLAITKKCAELLGGMISVTSVVGVGSVFTVRIPAKYST